jgi:hypothetical protein
MGRYIDWEDVIDRYPELETVGGADQISSAYIVYAESYLDAALASHFAMPFSQEVMILKDLAIDYTYWRAGRFKIDNAVEVGSAVAGTIQDLKEGKLIMTDVDGNEIPASTIRGGIYSTTQSYHNAFGMDDPIYWGVSSDQVDATTDERF